MYARDLAPEIQEMMKYYPIVTVIGPRQSGKSTLVQALYPDKPYVSLENPDERRLAQADPNSFLERFHSGAIIDEVQRYPELLSYLQGVVDASGKNGLFILTGSHQLALHAAITQSLAGRTAILKLLPLGLYELPKKTKAFTVDDYILTGMYPRIYQHQMPPTKFYRDYTLTYLERDVRQMVQVKELQLFQQFLHLCAGYVGQLINHDTFSHALGISATTVKHWLSILEASFVIFRLAPYHENFGKRLIKSKKLYFYDVGLASYLLGFQDTAHLTYATQRGALFENFIICEIYKDFLNHGIEPNLYFYRDSNQREIDLLLQSGQLLIPVEIKSSKTYTDAFLKNLKYFQKLVGSRCRTGYLIYTGTQEQQIGGFHLLNFKHLRALNDACP